MRRLALAGVAAALLMPAAASATTPATLPPGATIAGVDVSGLDPAGANAKLRATLAPVWERPIVLRVGGRQQQLLTARLGFAIDYAGMVAAGFKQAARGEPVQVALAKRIDGRRLGAAVKRIGRPFYKAPRSARLVLGVLRIRRIGGHNGRTIDSARLRRKLAGELRRPTPTRIVHGTIRLLRPPIGLKRLAREFGTYISVDRGHFKLRLFKHLRRVKTYRIAVGRAGLATPRGLRHVLDKQVNPAWHVPNAPWAGSLAGRTIPAGDPRDPLKGRWLGLGGGVGIHGTAEDWSIGRRASHGCIRMHVRDVIALYRRVPIGTPVLIR